MSTRQKIIVLFIIGYFLNCFLLSQVKNPDKPLKGDWDLKPQKVWEISEYGEDPLVYPGTVAVQNDGTFSIFEVKYGLNYIFDSKGKLITTFGPKGEGPGEIRGLEDVDAVNDKFIATDMGKLHFFYKNGKYEKSISFLVSSIFMSTFFINENECIFVPRKCGVNYKEHSDITYLNIKTMEKKIIKKGNPKKIFLRIAIFTPGTTAGFDYQNKELYYGVNSNYHINVIDIKGNVINSFSLDRKKRKLTYEMKKNYLDGIYGGAASNNRIIKTLPDELPYFLRIQIENGLVFVHVNYPEQYVDEQQIDIFSTKGKYLYRAKFKMKGSGKVCPINTIIKNEHFYTVMIDEEDDIKLAKFKISLPKTK